MSGVGWGFTNLKVDHGVKLGDTAKKIGALAAATDANLPTMTRDRWVDLMITAREELRLLLPEDAKPKKGGR